jgi:fucose permease
MKRNYFIVALVFLTFIVISFITNILGALNPDVINSFNLSLTLAALLPFFFFIAYGVMSIPAAMLIEKYREKRVMVAAFIISFSGALLFSLFPYYSVFLISLFLMGCGIAMLQVVINPLLRASGGEENFAFNSVMAQLLFGGASFLAPMYLTWLVNSLNGKDGNIVKSIFGAIVPASLPWTSLYWTFTAVLLVMTLLIIISKFPEVQLKDDEKAGSWDTHKKLFGMRTVHLYFIGVFAYVGTEQGTSYWMSKFLYTYHGYDTLTVGSSIVGWFWGLMSVGCLLGLFLLKIFDSRRVLLGAVVSALMFLTIALFGPGSYALIAFPMVGFSLSVMWSIVFSLALNSVESHQGTFSGILCTAIIGGALIQLLIGWLGDMIGLRYGMCIIYLTLSYVFGIGLWARPIINNETISMKKKKQLAVD